MAKPKVKTEEDIQVLEIQRAVLEVCLVGTSPLICNRMSEKAKRELLLPRGRKNAAEKSSTLKHDPIAEFQASPYLSRNDEDPTLLLIMGAMVKGALRGAAVDMPGASKAQLGRLTYIPDYYIPLYGVPQILMSVTRSKDMNRTPDIRSRAIVPQWACKVSVTYVVPLLRQQMVANLLAAAGLTQGIGDWRPEKGSGSFGQFRLAAADDPEFLAICRDGKRVAQTRAWKDPECYDPETEELLSWYDVEIKRRGMKAVA